MSEEMKKLQSMRGIEKIADEELHRDYKRVKGMHNDWELYSNPYYNLIVRKQYNTKYYSIGGAYKNERI